ncbi:MAG: hypothetical protein GY864_12360 [Desulfobacterales bacterium]|nr:hypothetical protein [Desulfobacterales bacterium]
MAEKFDEFPEMLKAFDDVELINIYKRRMAVKPLYDYFQKLTFLVGAEACGLNKNSLRSSHLRYRWESIRGCISIEGIEISYEWDKLIKKIYDIRNKVEHNDEFDPQQNILVQIREKAPEFAQWLSSEAIVYIKKTQRYSFKQAFHRLLHEYVLDARIIIHAYGERTPHVASIGYLMKEDELEYHNLLDLSKALETKLSHFGELKDVERSDLENLIRIVKITSIMQAREELLSKDGVCPSCGGKIVESEEYVGGGPENQPEPDGVVYRVGCEKCEYEIDNEFYST